MGVVSGIVLSYEFGTNWSRFSEVDGQRRRPAHGLRGAHRLLPGGDVPRHHALRLATGCRPGCMCFPPSSSRLAPLISAFWIMSANSWMQTPAGHEIRDGIAYPVDWLTVIFNPSFPYRFAHMVIAAYLTTAFVVIAVGARYLLAGSHVEEGRTMLRMGIGLRPCWRRCSCSSATARPEHAEAAADQDRGDRGHWDGAKPGDFQSSPCRTRRPRRTISRSPSRAARSCSSPIARTAISPASRVCRRRTGRRCSTVFFGFRIMVGIGVVMIAAALLGAWLWWRGRLFDTRWFLRIVAQSWWLGFIAVIAGWVVDRERPSALDRAGHLAHRRRHLAGRRRPASLRRWLCSSSSTASSSRWASITSTG